MNINTILSQLEKVISSTLRCNICDKTCEEPIRVKVCGHYFCLKCFKEKEAHLCPKCKLYYEERVVDYNNIARQTIDILSDLKIHLSEASCLENSVTIDQQTNIVYDNKTYHINYVDNLCNKVNVKGETPLHIACKRKNIENVKQIIKTTDVNIKDFAGWAPLHEAVESGSEDAVEILLKHGALIDIPGPDYETPLHKAVILGDEEIVSLLIKYGASKESINYFGKKPIDYTRNEHIRNIFSQNSTYTNRIEELFCNRKISVYFYYTENSYMERVLNNNMVRIEKDFDPKKVTHFIIRRSHKLSIKILRAILEGCYIVPQEWLDDFVNDRYFISVPHYTFIFNNKLNLGIQRALINTLLKRPKLFDGISFFIQGHNLSVEIYNIKFTKDSIVLVINAGGGKILHRAPTLGTCEGIMNFPYHSEKNSGVVRCCHYIIYEETNPPTLQYQMPEIKHKSSKWLIDCVINFIIAD